MKRFMLKNKKEKYLILLTAIILIAVTVFSVLNWHAIKELFKLMVAGVAIVKEYVLSLGIVGVLSISLLIIACFFFPVISSIPVQLASSVSYGLPFGIIHVLLSVFLASQLAFLFTRVIRVFQSPKQKEKQRLMEEKIRNSKRSILFFLVLAYLAPFIPFLLIHMVAANSGMKWWKYSLVTLLGPIPDVVTTLWLGTKITTTSSPMVSFLILLFVIACVILSLIYKEKIIDLIFTPKKEGGDQDGGK